MVGWAWAWAWAGGGGEGEEEETEGEVWNVLRREALEALKMGCWGGSRMEDVGVEMGLMGEERREVRFGYDQQEMCVGF